VVEDFIERFHATGGDVGPGLFPKWIKPPGGDVLVHFLVPLRVEIIAQPARDAPGILDGQGADGGFDFGDCAHANQINGKDTEAQVFSTMRKRGLFSRTE
jgi:hypothetical protein